MTHWCHLTVFPPIYHFTEHLWVIGLCVTGVIAAITGDKCSMSGCALLAVSGPGCANAASSSSLVLEQHRWQRSLVSSHDFPPDRQHHQSLWFRDHICHSPAGWHQNAMNRLGNFAVGEPPGGVCMRAPHEARRLWQRKLTGHPATGASVSELRGRQPPEDGNQAIMWLTSG